MSLDGRMRHMLLMGHLVRNSPTFLEYFRDAGAILDGSPRPEGHGSAEGGGATG